MDNSSKRLVEIFFYGLHMDAASLRRKGIKIRRPRAAAILHHRIVVREKAILLREKDALAHGMLYQLTHAEIEMLYAHQPAYRAEAFLVRDGAAALCAISMVHVKPPLDAQIDDAYADKLRDVLQRLGLPAEHVKRTG